MALCLLATYGLANAHHRGGGGGGGDEPTIPPEDDPSHYVGPYFGDLPEDLHEANEGAFEGGQTGTPEDTHENVAYPEEDLSFLL